MKVFCTKCNRAGSVNTKYFDGRCPHVDCDGFGDDVHDYFLYKTQIPDQKLEMKFRTIAHNMHDDKTYCPSCKRLLTGLHMGSNCYQRFIRKEAHKLYKQYLKENKK